MATYQIYIRVSARDGTWHWRRVIATDEQRLAEGHAAMLAASGFRVATLTNAPDQCTCTDDELLGGMSAPRHDQVAAPRLLPS